MTKILALDIGDQWTGIAISDSSQIIAKPYTTIAAPQIVTALTEILAKESVETIVVGYPKTMKGTESEQTKKVQVQYEKLTQKFPTVKWVLWDERLSSKRAQSVGKIKTKEDKLRSHAIAAAFILDSYLSFLKASKFSE